MPGEDDYLPDFDEDDDEGSGHPRRSGSGGDSQRPPPAARAKPVSLLRAPRLGHSEDVPTVVPVLEILRRCTRDELMEFARSVGLEQSDEDLRKLAARLLLFVIEAERQTPGLILRVRSRDEIAGLRYKPPRARPPSHWEISERLSERIDIDGELVPIRLSNYERVYSGHLATLLEREGQHELSEEDLAYLQQATHQDLDQAVAENAREDISESQHGRHGEGRAEEAWPWRPAPRRLPNALAEVLIPGPMASFYSVVGVEVPWDLDDGPWLREPGREIDVGGLVRALEKPASVKPEEIKGLKLLEPVARARARINNHKVPTGMKRRVRLFQTREPPPEGDDSLTELAKLLREDGLEPLEALVESAELAGVDDKHDERLKTVYRIVRETYGNPTKGLPNLELPRPQPRDDRPLLMGDILEIERWTDARSARWGLFAAMRRIKSAVDPLGRICFPSRWITASSRNDDGALELLSAKTHYERVEPILSKHVWSPLSAHAAGGRSAVYQIRYRFATDGTEVDEDLLEQRWGPPYRRR